MIPTPEITKRARELFVAHMRSQGYGGDHWDRLPTGSRNTWIQAAIDEIRRASKRGAKPRT